MREQRINTVSKKKAQKEKRYRVVRILMFGGVTTKLFETEYLRLAKVMRWFYDREPKTYEISIITRCRDDGTWLHVDKHNEAYVRKYNY